MNTTILQKVISELKTEKPRLDYVLGMLETMVEMQPDKPIHEDKTYTPFLPTPNRAGNEVQKALDNVFPEQATEAEILDAKARAALKSAQEMGQLS